MRASEDTAQLDSVAASCETVARAVLATLPAARRGLAPVVAELAAVLRELAGDPGSPETRAHAATRVVAAGENLPSLTKPPLEPDVAAAVVSLQLLIDAIMNFAGVEDAAGTALGR